LPATADALTAIAQQVTQATGQLHRAAGQLSACTGIAERAHDAIDRLTTSVTQTNEVAQGMVAALSQQIRAEYTRAVWVLCGAACMVGILGGIAFERWRGSGIQVSPEAIAAPVHGAEPASSAEPAVKTPIDGTPRNRRREPHAPHRDTDPRHGTDVEHGSNSRGTTTRADDAKPKA
jgi:hypothetical protein